MMFHQTEATPYEASLMGALRRIGAAFARYAGARGRLAKAEADKAKRQLVQIAILGVAIVFCALAGYAGLVVSLTAWLATDLLHGNWALALLMTGGLHVAGAAGCAFFLNRMWKRGVFFAATRREFKEDHKWLTTRTSMN
ncbi:MAG: phage holin family protein [Verrucomicrobiales bacterium]